MITVKVTFANGDIITTSINGTFEEANEYYLGKWFNLGPVEDNMQKAISIEEITE